MIGLPLRRTVTRKRVAASAWIDAAQTQDQTLGVVPAGTLIHEVIADTTTAYAGLAGTITLQVGTSTGGQDLVTAHDVKTATRTQGGIVTPGGHLPSFSALTTISARLTSGTGNLGDGTTSNLSAGVTDFYIITEALK